MPFMIGQPCLAAASTALTAHCCMTMLCPEDTHMLPLEPAQSTCSLLLRTLQSCLCVTLPSAHLQECHCMLFLTEDNDFRGDEQAITLDEVTEATKGMSGVQR